MQSSGCSVVSGPSGASQPQICAHSECTNLLTEIATIVGGVCLASQESATEKHSCELLTRIVAFWYMPDGWVHPPIEGVKIRKNRSGHIFIWSPVEGCLRSQE